MDAHAVPVDLYVRHEFPLDVPGRLAVGAWSVRPRPRCNRAMITPVPCRARRLALRSRRQMSATAAGCRTGVPFHSLPKDAFQPFSGVLPRRGRYSARDEFEAPLGSLAF